MNKTAIGVLEFFIVVAIVTLLVIAHNTPVPVAKPSPCTPVKSTYGIDVDASDYQGQAPVYPLCQGSDCQTHPHPRRRSIK